MKRNTVYIQFRSKGIIILKDKKIHKYELNNIVDNYKVINNKFFYEKISNILNELQINNKFLTDNLKIIIDETYNETDKYILKLLFKDLSFNKIEYIDIKDLLQLTEEEILINIDSKNIKIYTISKIYEINIYFNNHYEIIKSFLKNILNKKIKYLKLFGEYKDLKTICNKLSKETYEVYMYTNSDIIPISKLIY